jgi:alkylation response protein AidB-like acyl-CoA dehydrogenase
MAGLKRSSAHLPEWARAFQCELFEAGYLVPGWPPELGGRNATPQEQMAYFEVITERLVPRSLNPQGLSICAASIVEFGTEDQKERFVLPTLRGEITWCLGMSEPNAGSDLASLTTRAERRDGHFVVNGQKVWTSGAHEADYCMCYVRTDPEAPKHRGISVIIMDMRTPGITCRPLPELTDQHHADFNEVFFTDVVVPEENLLGELHGGWAVSQGSLRHERGMLWIMNVSKMERTLKALVRLAGRPDGRGGTLGDDARIAEAIGRLATDTAAMRCLGYRGFEKSTRGEMSPEHVVLKLFTSEAEQRACLFAQDALGVEGLDLDGPGPSRFTEWDLAHFEPSPTERSAMSSFYDGAWAVQYLRSFAGTIAGGTSEIQRNIVAERVLGLPRG